MRSWAARAAQSFWAAAAYRTASSSISGLAGSTEAMITPVAGLIFGIGGSGLLTAVPFMMEESCTPSFSK